MILSIMDGAIPREDQNKGGHRAVDFCCVSCQPPEILSADECWAPFREWSKAGYDELKNQGRLRENDFKRNVTETSAVPGLTTRCCYHFGVRYNNNKMHAMWVTISKSDKAAATTGTSRETHQYRTAT